VDVQRERVRLTPNLERLEVTHSEEVRWSSVKATLFGFVHNQIAIW
jgi:hypothetical protein